MILVLDRRALTQALASYYMFIATHRRVERKSGFTARLGSAVPEKCLICQGEITVGGRIVMCPYCGSVYHFDCLKMLSEEGGIPLEDLECLYCGKKLPMRMILELAGEGR